jgi:hypothetical protein
LLSCCDATNAMIESLLIFSVVYSASGLGPLTALRARGDA